jgi:2-polyprenyl-3-methyl-5-hydroxy-6-metoxy-1,4-benzoquinol methylase
MKPEFAKILSDNIAKTGHPKLDYRTVEAQLCTMKLRSYLQQLIFSGCKALDLGCGTGKFTFELEYLGAEATGLDCSQEAIRVAQKFATEMGSSSKFHVGFFENLPFLRESFDIVIFPQNIIECSYEEMDLISRQISFVLRPRGVFLLAMKDGLDRLQENQNSKFDIITGNRQSTISIPALGDFLYETTFWTVGFACFVISRYLSFSKMDKSDDGLYIIEFKN